MNPESLAATESDMTDLKEIDVKQIENFINKLKIVKKKTSETKNGNDSQKEPLLLLSFFRKHFQNLFNKLVNYDDEKEDILEDWKIDVESHISSLQNSTTPLLVSDKVTDLIQIMDSSKVRGIAEAFNDNDKKAWSRRITFEKIFQHATRCIFLTSVCSGLLLGSAFLQHQIFPHDDAKSWFEFVLGILSLILGALGSMWLGQVREGELYEKWIDSRMVAEKRRLEFFAAVTGVPLMVSYTGLEKMNQQLQRQQSSGYNESLQKRTDRKLALLKLEYFRRFLLDNQIQYFQGRRDLHAKRWSNIVKKGSFAAAMASVATGSGALLGKEWGALGALSVISTGIVSYHEAYSGVFRHQENEKRFETNLTILREIKFRIGSVRHAILNGNNDDALVKFVDATMKILLRELKERNDLNQNGNETLRNLDEEIQKSK